MNHISAIITFARQESREALGYECPDFVTRWLAAVALAFAKGSHGYLRLPPAEPYQEVKPGPRKGGL